MIRIAITGGIGSGKSYVCRMLQQRGIPVYIADEEAKRLTATDPLIRHRLIERVGEQVYHANGSLNKSFLAEYLFASEAHVKEVNSIIHPRVKEDFAQWASVQKTDIVGLESAILYEAGFEDAVDAVVMVYAPRALRLRRAMLRDGASKEQIECRMAQQMSDEEKKKRAWQVIDNDEVHDLNAQLDALILRMRNDF